METVLGHEVNPMPIVFTFDLTGAQTVDRNRIQSFFERFGWQNLGGSAYRYPRLGAEREHPVEDWFNHIIPALMLFRAYVTSSGRELPQFSLDVQSSAGRNVEFNFGTPPIPGAEVELYETTQQQFGLSNLREWLDEVTFPYPTS